MSKGSDSKTKADGMDEASVRDLPSGANIDKIRSILFGQQMRDYDTRFVRLEERVARELVEVREETRRRADEIEAYLHKEVEALSARLRAEHDGRVEALRDAHAGLEQLGKTLEQRTQRLDDSLERSHREFRQQLHEQGKGLGDKIRENHNEVARLLEQEVAKLRSGKVDRTALASMLGDLAARIAGQQEE